MCLTVSVLTGWPRRASAASWPSIPRPLRWTPSPPSAALALAAVEDGSGAADGDLATRASAALAAALGRPVRLERSFADQGGDSSGQQPARRSRLMRMTCERRRLHRQDGEDARHQIEDQPAEESEQHRGHGGWREGGQTHFRVRMASPRFAGMGRVAQHRLVHQTLGDIVPRIHALALELAAE